VSSRTLIVHSLVRIVKRTIQWSQSYRT